MIIFFCNNIQGELAFFSEEETKHCTHVLRKKIGDSVQFIDGVGHWYEAEIIEVSKRQTTVQIKAKHTGTDHTNFRLHIAVAPLKSMERFEWFLEKATEIGIDEISPIMTEHTERTKLRYDRLEKIILSAAKQCLRTRLPKLNELIDFEDFIKKNETQTEEARFIPHCHLANLSHLKNNCPAASSVTILIGPEGDFSMDEVSMAKANGFKEVGLGANRLRTETAAIVACHTVHMINS